MARAATRTTARPGGRTPPLRRRPHARRGRAHPGPDNRYDPAAIAVEIQRLQVGYLRRTDAVAYRATVEEARIGEGRATCEAIIRGGWDRGRGDVGAFGVVLLLPETWA